MRRRGMGSAVWAQCSAPGCLWSRIHWLPQGHQQREEVARVLAEACLPLCRQTTGANRPKTIFFIAIKAFITCATGRIVQKMSHQPPPRGSSDGTDGQLAVTSVRIQSGSGAAFCCGKSTQIVVAPPAAHITPGWSTRSIVPQVSNVVRPGSLT